jgi:LmbE family N-acetylglucosaminyl deacetylase
VVTGIESAGFDHLTAGTPETHWSTSTLLRTAPTFDLAGARRLIVVAAHPDDETLGAGGLLATAAQSGTTVVVVIATLGERSHPHSRTHTPDQLRSIRRAEVTAAVALLAPHATVRLLELPDGDLTDHEAALTAAVAESIDLLGTVVAAPWEGDGHPDHAAAGRAARAAATGPGVKLLQYPIWAWHWGVAADLPPHLARLDLHDAAYSAKQAALQCHRSQIRALSGAPGDEAIVGPQFAEHFDRRYEIFVDVDASIGRLGDSQSLGQDFFDDFYGDQPDPWGFESRWYEKRKRAITMASLPRESFRSVFEPGCSIGVLTAELASRSDRVLATDISERPLLRARRRLAAFPGVRFEQRRIPDEWPDEQFDLIVLSEVGYYCGADDLRRLAERASSSLTSDGVLLACHWRHPVGEYPLRGDEVHRVLKRAPGLAVLAEHVEEDFILNVFTRPTAGSVARATGLVP